MFNAAKETPCTRCMHKDVCQHKRDFIDYSRQIENVRVQPKISGQGSPGIPINSVEYIVITIQCKYHRPDAGTLREVLNV